MATKVGGFTKSGVVQCVKLVEESPSEMFNGTVSSNIITLNNGMKITFTYGPSDTPAGYTQTGSYLSFKDNTYGTPFLRLDINNTSTDKRVLASITNEEAWNSSEDLSIDMISGSIGAAVPSAPCKWVIEYKGQSETYSISSQGHIITNAVGGHTLITSANRTPTVRMGKDGTLRCKELVEEEVVDNIDSFAPLQTSSSGSHTFILKNGTYIDLYENDTLVNVNTLGSIACIQSSTPVLLISFYADQIGYTSSGSQTEWDYNGSIDILRISISAPLSSISNINRLTVNGTASYTKSSNTTSSISFTLDGNSNSWNIPYNERFKTPTVRVFKDGTIRCAEVEEATVTQLRSDWGTPTKTTGRAEFTFPNGYVLRLRQQGGQVARALADNAVYAFRMSTSSTSGSACMVLYKNTTTSQTTVPNYTIYDAFFEEGNSIAYCACTNPNMSFSGVYYLELLNSKGDIVGSLSNASSSSSYLFYAGTAFDVPVFDRISYSWPGSTIVKATNTFITSDNKNFLTNTGDQFMVR